MRVTSGRLLAVVWAVSWLLVSANVAVAMPPGFSAEPVLDLSAVGIAFADDGRMFAWEREGRVWTVVDGVQQPEPLIDISDEVGFWVQHGLMGFAADPDFLSNGYIYLLYVVDRYHLMNAGTPGYDPMLNDYHTASIARITRYTARVEDGFHSVDPASRLVLLGETPDTGAPVLQGSHGAGSLVFGSDGTLLASFGDGAGFGGVDDGGGAAFTYSAAALADGIIGPEEDIGAFRSQFLGSLAGKIIRIDPGTGDGVTSNPFFDAIAPRAARSRIWVLGLRNPYRFNRRPGTGSVDPADGNPGVLYIGDVGWGTWEELNVADSPGQNFGWPVFEGMDTQSAYAVRLTPNLDAPNPLFDDAGCTQSHFHFQDLIVQDTLDPSPFFGNPCDRLVPVPATVMTFVHSRPAMDWGRVSQVTRTAGFVDDIPVGIELNEPGSPVSGIPFDGRCSTGGVWYTGSAYPADYAGSCFHGDYSTTWVRNFAFDEADGPLSVRVFDTDHKVTSMAVHPIDGMLYYAVYPMNVRRIAFQWLPPVAVAAADLTYGPGPLTVQFDAGNSEHPQGLALSYEWDFDDGSPVGTGPMPMHTFDALPGVPTQYDVSLTATDTEGGTSQTSIVISVNNTPPSVAIVSPPVGATYSIEAPEVQDLTAEITDAEHDAAELSCQWQTVLVHNGEDMPEPVDPACVTTTVTQPLGCGLLNEYFYRVTLTVTDAAGLSTSEEVTLLPACNDCPADLNGDRTVNVLDLLELILTWGDCPPSSCAGDVNGDSTVNVQDMLEVILSWGGCL